jgi:hypothetical protein
LGIGTIIVDILIVYTYIKNKQYDTGNNERLVRHSPR